CARDRKPYLNNRSSVVITVVYASSGQAPSLSSRTVALPRAHNPSSRRCSSGPSCCERLRNGEKIRFIPFSQNLALYHESSGETSQLSSTCRISKRLLPLVSASHLQSSGERRDALAAVPPGGR